MSNEERFEVWQIKNDSDGSPIWFWKWSDALSRADAEAKASELRKAMMHAQFDLRAVESVNQEKVRLVVESRGVQHECDSQRVKELLQDGWTPAMILSMVRPPSRLTDEAKKYLESFC